MGKPKAKKGKPAKAGTQANMVAITFDDTSASSAAPPVPQAPPAPQPAAPPPPIEWYYMDFNNVQQGPTTDAGLRQLYDMGDIHDFTYVWNENMAEWAPIRDQQGLLNQTGGGIAAMHGAHAFC